eukprot:scaffold25210_cov132-Cylindrotheca_fusiformis.AAC.2
MKVPSILCSSLWLLVGCLSIERSNGFVVTPSTTRDHISTKATTTATRLQNDLGGGIQEAWNAYNDVLVSAPLLTKSVTASIILGSADIAGQALENYNAKDKEDKDLDIGRTVRFAIFGLVLQAPWNHFYYKLLDGAIPPTDDPFTPTTGIKVVIDQFVQAPIFTVLIFGFLGFLEGKNTQTIQKQLDEDYVDTMVANWKLWVPATVVNIAFVPPIFRVLYLNCVFFFWSIFLSLKLNKEEEVDA